MEWWEQSPGWVGVKTEWQVRTQKQDVYITIIMNKGIKVTGRGCLFQGFLKTKTQTRLRVTKIQLVIIDTNKDLEHRCWGVAYGRMQGRIPYNRRKMGGRGRVLQM